MKSANKALEFYCEKNISENSFYNKNKNYCILSKNFLSQPNEIILRSITKIIQKISKNYYPPRGKSINNFVSQFNSNLNIKKATLGGCIFEKVDETLIISKE